MKKLLLALIYLEVLQNGNAIKNLKKQFKQMGAKQDEIKALISGINDSTNNIAADLERIAGGLSGGLSADEADGVIAELKTAADKLKAVADTNPEPDPQNS